MTIKKFKKRTKLVLILQYDDGLIYRIYGSSTAFRYDFPTEPWDCIKSALVEHPYVCIEVKDSRVEAPPQILRLSKRMVY